MPYHSRPKVQKLQQALQARFDQLMTAVAGSEASEHDLRAFQLTGPHVAVRPSDVRIAVDDFQTILKEVKGTLGKR
jgi:hypothetical protein